MKMIVMKKSKLLLLIIRRRKSNINNEKLVIMWKWKINMKKKINEENEKWNEEKCYKNEILWKMKKKINE